MNKNFKKSFFQVVASFLPHSSVKPALFWQVMKRIHHLYESTSCVAVTQRAFMITNVFFQFLLQSYSAGFNYANRNSSSEQVIHIYIYIYIYIYICMHSDTEL